MRLNPISKKNVSYAVMMHKISDIKNAIETADRLESALINDITFEIGGFTSPKIRHLMNNLGALASNYIEIGCHRGSTLLAALYNNCNIKTATVFDNFSEFEDGTVKKELYQNIENYKQSITNPMLIEKDCFEYNWYFGDAIIDIYLYDGNHSFDSQKKAFTHYYHALADECIVCIDDYNWHDVQKGTQDGIKECGFEILFEQHLIDGYHNGFYVCLLKKNKT